VIILSDAATEIRAELEVVGYGEEAQKRVQAVLKSMDDLRAWLSAQRNLIAPRPNITVRAITQRARNTLQVLSSIRRLRASKATKRTPRVSSRSD
jgi:hypothetical protein